ncbi:MULTISPECIES: hypothetical protein [unclassified Adlercreutzia]|uniref:hypothetical protein n=1 Tax=unclassified Adlercreutzia TaxID=2636013 RepID=UPI0013EBBB12|nr:MULTISPECIES: hypothetical protein [unclassified Adlercreutzia]
MEATQQMNVRIGVQRKRDGDARLASLGFTPSKAVQGFYDFLSREGVRDADVRTVIEPTPRDGGREERLRKLDDFHAMQRQVTAFYAERGITRDPLPSMLGDRELYEEALVDRYEERGLL